MPGLVRHASHRLVTLLVLAAGAAATTATVLGSRRFPSRDGAALLLAARDAAFSGGGASGGGPSGDLASRWLLGPLVRLLSPAAAEPALVALGLILVFAAFVPFIRAFGRRTAFSAGFAPVVANNALLAEGRYDRMFAVPLVLAASALFRGGVPALWRPRGLLAALAFAAGALLDVVGFAALLLTAFFIRERRGGWRSFVHLAVAAAPAAALAVHAHLGPVLAGADIGYTSPFRRLIDAVQSPPPLWGIGTLDLVLSWLLLAFIVGGIALERLRAGRRARTLDVETRRLPVLLPAVMLVVTALFAPDRLGPVTDIPERMLLFAFILLVPFSGVAARLFRRPHGVAFVLVILGAAVFQSGCHRGRRDLDRAMAAAPFLPLGASFTLHRGTFRPRFTHHFDPTLHADCRIALERGARHAAHDLPPGGPWGLPSGPAGAETPAPAGGGDPAFLIVLGGAGAAPAGEPPRPGWIPVAGPAGGTRLWRRP